MRTHVLHLCLFWAVLILTACNLAPAPDATPTPETLAAPIGLPKIDRHPAPSVWQRAPMRSLPAYDPTSDNPYQIDLRSANLTELDLRNSLNDLLYANFDTRTRWPSSEQMPNGFEWQRILELGKNPGLGLRRLHALGHTGRGVNMAIIDQPLLLEHQEYTGRFQLYEEINISPDTPSEMHGPAVASIALGKTAGVAPEANLFYIATWAFDPSDRPSTLRNFHTYAQAVHRILEINQQLPQDQKIRVLAMQVGWRAEEAGYDEMTAAANEARAAGIFVVSSSIEQTHGFKIQGLGRSPLTDPDRFESFDLGLFWAASPDWLASDRLLIPMDSRTVASFSGPSDYAFYRAGGWSWITPYLAGVYALAVQVDPAITPNEFWSWALKTGETVQIRRGSETLSLGPILDPVALVNALEHR